MIVISGIVLSTIQSKFIIFSEYILIWLRNLNVIEQPYCLRALSPGIGQYFFINGFFLIWMLYCKLILRLILLMLKERLKERLNVARFCHGKFWIFGFIVRTQLIWELNSSSHLSAAMNWYYVMLTTSSHFKALRKSNDVTTAQLVEDDYYI